ncbi:MAG: hypothetical protein D6690_15435 [Nitrospirae bacterium]|nr:MAG: hypothetical protein D6690_15435 [Nitrospirota bacterium]
MSNQRKLMVLLGLLALWGGLIVLESDDGLLTPVSKDMRADMAHPRISDSVSSHADRLIETLTPMETPKGQVALAKPRNIFSPLTWEQPRPKPVRQAKTTEPQRSSHAHAPLPRQPDPPPGPSAAERVMQRARQQLRQYRFLGYMTKSGESQAFLTNGQAIYIVKQGEFVDGRIHVSKIEPTAVVLSMIISETGDQVEASIPLVDDQSS